MQVLMGVCCPNCEFYFFDSDGNHLRVETRQLSVPPSKGGRVYTFDSAAELSLEADAAKWADELAFRESPIDVYQFAANFTSIEDLPGNLIELQENPEKFDDGTREELLEWKAKWSDAGLFVLWWGDELWINRNGKLNSS